MRKWIIIGGIIGVIDFFCLAFVPIVQKLWVATFPLGAAMLSFDQFFSPFICQFIYSGLFIVNVAAFAGSGYCLALAVKVST